MISVKAKVNEAVIAYDGIYTVMHIDGSYVYLENYQGVDLYIPNDFLLIRGVKHATARAENTIEVRNVSYC